MHIYYPHQVPEEGALQQTWAYKLRFNASAVPSTKSRYDRYARGGYSGTHEAYRKSGLLSLQEAIDHAILRAVGDQRADVHPTLPLTLGLTLPLGLTPPLGLTLGLTLGLASAVAQ